MTNDEKKRLFEAENFKYSWTGPNALARSALVERQERLQYNCEEVLGDVQDEISRPESFRNILVDDQHELLYCYVPKVKTGMSCQRVCEYFGEEGYTTGGRVHVRIILLLKVHVFAFLCLDGRGKISTRWLIAEWGDNDC